VFSPQLVDVGKHCLEKASQVVPKGHAGQARVSSLLQSTTSSASASGRNSSSARDRRVARLTKTFELLTSVLQR